MSARTGDILDYEVKSLVCHQCSKATKKLGNDTDEMNQWQETHKPFCNINHKGTSDAMESSAAVDIFSRSIEKRHLKYTTYVGDGDSNSFGKVKAAIQDKYGDRYPIVKEDCVGHIQKRMGTALRSYKKGKKGMKLSDGKTVGGKARLTDLVIDKIQGYYGKAIRSNKNNLEGMHRAVWAIFCHTIANSNESLEQQHRYCPQASDTWCKFVKDKIHNTKSYSEEGRLPEVFHDELKPIFTRLSDRVLLQRCLAGMTQNQNECVNGQVWARCPKTRFCGKRRVVVAVCETIAVSNTGAASKAKLFEKSRVHIGKNTFRGLRFQDKTRLQSAAQKISEKYIRTRTRKRQASKKKSDMSYLPGGFGTNPEPDFPVAKKRKPSIGSKTLGKNQRKGNTGKHKKTQDEELSEDSKTEEPKILFREPIFERIHGNSSGL
ncbi:uncharacterized protein LOC135693699 [Rhopilema esculentum]|uniref:uncharacterized protein LOC135693699 n=1 Tax=Rhopilema esculentum TaxID=499914 RepID=UPI0031D0E5F0